MMWERGNSIFISILATNPKAQTPLVNVPPTIKEANQVASPTNAQTDWNLLPISQEENDSMRNEVLVTERKAMDVESTMRRLTESVDTLRRNAENRMLQ
eukprot:8130736-Ditylum_brightwellii.AAC.1